MRAVRPIATVGDLPGSRGSTEPAKPAPRCHWATSHQGQRQGVVRTLRSCCKRRERSPRGLALGDGPAGVPSRCPATVGRLVTSRIKPGASENPRRHGVGVPHLAGAEFVATPDGCWKERDQVEELTREGVVVGDAYGARDRRGDIGDHAVTPSVDLVSEGPERPQPPCPDGAFGDHATILWAARARDRGHLNDERSLRGGRDESGVVQVASRPPLQERAQRFECSAADANGVCPCPERRAFPKKCL